MAEEKDNTSALDDKNQKITAPSLNSAAPATIDEDSDPDFDDLDGRSSSIMISALFNILTLHHLPDVLDQFSPAADQSKTKANGQPSPPTPSASGPGRPTSSTKSPSAPPPPPLPLEAAESEEDFMARLASEMSSVLSSVSHDLQTSPVASADDISKLDQELNDLTRAMEKEGVKPEALLKAILGDAAAPDLHTPSSPPTDKESFEETIRRTMARMQASNSTATSAATDGHATASDEDMLATLLQAMESSSSGPDPTSTSSASADPASEDSLSKMFLGMMEQLTNKEMLYEPMKELDSKYPAWLAQHEPRLSPSDLQRYRDQRRVVGEIVAKFEEVGYSDGEAGCREFIWERMQRMQAMGTPPEDLIANPLPGMVAEEGGGGVDGDEGCPTQ